MAVTYYVALPFIRTEDGAAPGEAQECQSEAAAGPPHSSDQAVRLFKVAEVVGFRLY